MPRTMPAVKRKQATNTKPSITRSTAAEAKLSEMRKLFQCASR